MENLDTIETKINTDDDVGGICVNISAVWKSWQTVNGKIL